MLHQHVRNAEPLDAQLQSVIRDELSDGRAEPTGERMFLEGDDVSVIALQLE